MGRGSSSLFYTILSLAVPMLIHGIYDTLAFLGTDEATYGLLVFVVLLYIAALRTIKKMSDEDRLAGFYPEARVIEYDSDILGN